MNDEWREALEHIAYPIQYLQRKAERERCVLNGQIANELANDAGYLRKIAQDALRLPKEREGE